MLRRRIICSLVTLGFSCTLFAQGAKVEPRVSGQVGVDYVAGGPDFGPGSIQGIGIYGNYTVGAHLGVAGEINLPRFHTPGDIGESTYLYGARYQLNHGRFHPYAKFLFGIGSFQYQSPSYAPSHLHYPAYVPGGGIDLYLNHKVNIRLIDFEYQFLPSFFPHGLTPYQGSIGVARRF